MLVQHQFYLIYIQTQAFITTNQEISRKNTFEGLYAICNAPTENCLRYLKKKVYLHRIILCVVPLHRGYFIFSLK